MADAPRMHPADRAERLLEALGVEITTAKSKLAAEHFRAAEQHGRCAGAADASGEVRRLTQALAQANATLKRNLEEQLERQRESLSIEADTSSEARGIALMGEALEALELKHWPFRGACGDILKIRRVRQRLLDTLDAERDSEGAARA